MKKFESLNEADLNEVNGGSPELVLPSAIFPALAKWIASKLFD